MSSFFPRTFILQNFLVELTKFRLHISYFKRRGVYKTSKVLGKAFITGRRLFRNYRFNIFRKVLQTRNTQDFEDKKKSGMLIIYFVLPIVCVTDKSFLSSGRHPKSLRAWYTSPSPLFLRASSCQQERIKHLLIGKNYRRFL